MIYHFFPNVLLCLAFNFLLFFGKHSFVLLFDLSKRFIISRPCTIPVLFYTVALFQTLFEDLLRAKTAHVLWIIVGDELFYGSN